MAIDVEALEARGKLQVKVARTLMRQKLIMTGNVLLVAYLFALALMLIWWVAMVLIDTPQWFGYYAHVLGIPLPRLLWLASAGMTFFKLAAALLLLCPGLACRICGGVMKP